MLTRQDINALKQADKLIFRGTKDNPDTWKLHSGTIMAYKEKTEKLPYGAEYRLSVKSRFHHYKGKHYTKAFESIIAAQYDTCLQTALGFLRPNDELILQWTTDNQNQYLVDANLHHDILYLVIRRTAKNGKVKDYTFHVADSLCENNSARMVA